MVTAIFLPPAFFSYSSLHADVWVGERVRDRKRDGETERRKAARKWGSLNGSGNAAAEL